MSTDLSVDQILRFVCSGFEGGGGGVHVGVVFRCIHVGVTYLGLLPALLFFVILTWWNHVGGVCDQYIIMLCWIHVFGCL